MKSKSNTIFKQMRLLSVTLSLFLLNGCTSWFYTPGMSELEKLCEKDAGMKIYETVEVEGYFNGYLDYCYACWNEVIRNGFTYIEFENKAPESYHAITETGYWRLEKVARNSGRCHLGIDKKLEKKRASTPFLKNFCIAAEKVDKPKSRYAIAGERKEWIVSDYHRSTITRLNTRIWEIDTDKALGTWISYLLNPWPQGFDYGKVYDCVDIGAIKREQPLIQQTLKLQDK